MAKTSPVSRLESEEHKRKNSIVHDSTLPNIVPPSPSSRRKQMTRAKTVPARALEKVIDVDVLSEDYTPTRRAERSNDWIDFSVVTGDESGNYDLPDEEFVLSEGEQAKMAEDKKAAAPEKRIAIFAFRLAMLEKAASIIGTLAFLWATVVLLGGFASDVPMTDFWVVTTIIVAEGARIFNRSHQLEWQGLSSKSLGSLPSRLANSFRRKNSSVYSKLKVCLKSRIHKSGGMVDSTESSVTSSSTRPASSSTKPGSALTPERLIVRVLHSRQERRWSKASLPVIPYAYQVVTAEDVSNALYLLQLVSAMVCIALPVWRISQIHREIWRIPSDDTPGNTKEKLLLSLSLFYALSIIEASLFLLEKCYWEVKFRVSKLLDKVIEEANLKGDENLDLLVKQFYYDVYGECLRNSVFDGLDMDLVSYGLSWLQGEDSDRQLAGARLLNRLVSGVSKKNHSGPGTDTLRKIGTTPGIIERLVEMLSWDSRHEKVLLSEIATLVCCLVVFNRNCSRIVAVPGSIDGVVSLLMTYNDYSPEEQKHGELSRKPPLQLWLTGLVILRYLCKDHKNSLKIGETPGLLAILVTFIEVRDESTFDPRRYYGPEHFRNKRKTFKKSLQVLGLLARATNTSGERLRRRIAGVISGLKNLRDVIEYGRKEPELQYLAVEILYHLSLESDVRQRIGATGGVLRNLFKIFALYDSFRQSQSPPGSVEPLSDKKAREQRLMAAERAGETLTRLALQEGNKTGAQASGSQKTLIEGMLDSLLTRDIVASNAARILQNVVNVADREAQSQVVRRMLGLTDSASQKKFLEVMVDCLVKPDRIASSAAMILESVLPQADEEAQREVARRSTPLVIDKIMSSKGARKSEIYEACLGLGSRILKPLDTSIYKEMFNRVDRVEFVKQLMKNLQHTPTTDHVPRIRRYSVEVILAFIAKDDTFLDAFQRTNIDLREVLGRTLDSISEVENFCLFSGLSGYVRYDTEMEDLVLRAIAGVEEYNARTRTGQSS